MKTIPYIYLFLLFVYNHNLTAQIPSVGANKSAYVVFKKAEKKFYNGNLMAGERMFEKSANYYKKNSNVDGFVIAKAMEAIVLLNQGKPKKAFKVFKYAEELFDAQSPRNKAAQAYLSLCIGKYHLEYEESKEADVFLQEANRILGENPEYVSPIFEVELQQSMGKFYLQKGEQQGALQFFQKMLAAVEKVENETGNSGFANAKMLDRVSGLVEGVYDKMAAPDKAVEYYQNMLDTKGDKMDAAQKSKIKFYAGKNAFKFTDYETAYQQLLDALDGGELSKTDEAKTKAMLATIAMSVRDYEDALMKNGDALNIHLSINTSSNDIFQSFIKQGQICQELEGADNSVYWYKKTLKTVPVKWTLASELKKYELEKIKHKKDATLNVSFNIALLNFKRAELFLDLLPAKSKTKARLELSMARGFLYFNAGYYDKATYFYENARTIIGKNYSSKLDLLSETYRYLASIQLEKKQMTSALSLIEKAMEAALIPNAYLAKDGLPDSYKAINHSYEMLHALVVKSAILHSIYSQNPSEVKLQRVLKYVEYGRNMLSQLKKIHRHEATKYQLSELTEKMNHQAIATTRILYLLTDKDSYLEMIFNYMEQSKSSLLLQAVQQLRAQKVVNIPDYVIEKEQKLKTKISYYTSELHYEVQFGEQSSEERILEIQKKLRSVQEEYPEYLDYIQKTFPEYYALKYEPTMATLKDLQSNLNEKETFVNYVIIDSLIHIYAVGASLISYQTSDIPVNFKNKIAKYINSLKGKKEPIFLRYSNLLYTVLLQPIEANILGKDLIIIPDGVLNYIPFEVIPTEIIPQTWKKGDFSLYKKIPYLLKSSSVVYNYSATLFLASRQRQKEIVAKGFVGYAPDFTKIDSFKLTHKDQKKKYEDLLLEPLDNAAIEVAMIGELTNGTTWIGELATETAFKNDAAKYGVVHFATHGILNNKFPLYSNLVMLGDDKEDGLLHTYELYNMQINAELVALSACNTGVGKIQKGEGAMSIARGFAYAGCPNIAMTLWPVSDQATQILMEHFYTNMMMGMTKAEALRQAKLHFVEAGDGLITVPYFWSGMLIVGTPDKLSSLQVLSFRKRRPFLYWGGLGVFVLVSMMVISSVIKRKNTA